MIQFISYRSCIHTLGTIIVTHGYGLRQIWDKIYRQFAGTEHIYAARVTQHALPALRALPKNKGFSAITLTPNREDFLNCS